VRSATPPITTHTARAGRPGTLHRDRTGPPSPIGRGSGLKIRPVCVRVARGAHSLTSQATESRSTKSTTIHGLHALRHYSAAELLAAGVGLPAVFGRLGHGGGGASTPGMPCPRPGTRLLRGRHVRDPTRSTARLVKCGVLQFRTNGPSAAESHCGCPRCVEKGLPACQMSLWSWHHANFE
jgi:hypothetical protein